MEFLYMAKELNGLSDQGIVTLAPNEEEFPCSGHEDRAVKEAWGPTEWRCDLAQGSNNLLSFC